MQKTVALSTVQRPVASVRSRPWNEHYILSTLRESTHTISSTQKRRWFGTQAAQPHLSVIDAMIKLVSLRVNKRAKFITFHSPSNLTSGIATRPYKELFQDALFAEIEAANNVGDAKRAAELLKQLYNPRTNLPTTDRAWIEQLRLYRLTRKGDVALDAIELHIPRCGIVPTQEMYEITLRALGVSGLGNQIAPVLGNMQRKGVWPSSKVLYAALAGLISSNRKAEAIALFSGPDFFFASLVRPSLTYPRVEIAEMPSKYSKPNKFHYGLMVDMHCGSGEFDKAALLLKEMVRNNVTPNERTVAAVVRPDLSKKDVGPAEILAAVDKYESMLRDLKVDEADVRKSGESFYGYALQALKTSPENAKQIASTIIQRAMTKRIVFTSVFLNAAMEAHMWAGEGNKALGMFRRMVLGSVFAGGGSYALRDSATAHTTPPDRKLRVAPDDMTLRILLRICNRGRDWQHATKYWRLFVDHFGVVVSAKSLGLLVSILSSAGQQVAAMRLIEQAKASLGSFFSSVSSGRLCSI